MTVRTASGTSDASGASGTSGDSDASGANEDRRGMGEEKSFPCPES